MKKIFLSFCLLFSSFSFALTPTQRIKALEDNLQGKTFMSTATMKVVRDNDSRQMKIKLWWKERKFALIKILEPQKDKDTGNLRIGTDLWQYLPKVNRIIRIPSSMMLQSWMGSDFSNDDLVKNGSLFNDYTHKLVKKDKIEKQDVEIIECLPRPDAPVVWGKIIVTVRVKDSAPLKQEFYSEKGKLIKILEGSNIKKFGTHNIPTTLKMTNVTKKNTYTVIEYEAKTVKFDDVINDSFFNQQQLRRSNL